MPRAPSQSCPTATPEPAPLDLEALGAHWRLALNRAEDAQRAARKYLPPTFRRLADERRRTALLLDEVAREHQVHLVHRLTAPRPSRRMLGLPSDVSGCVFELEGVLTAGAEIHAAAWAMTFDELLLLHSERTGERYGPFAPFNPRTDYGRYIEGRPRIDGVRGFLESRGLRLTEIAVHEHARRKNEALQRLLATRGIKAYDGSRHYLEAVRDAGLRTAVVSASANTETMLAKAGLSRLVDARVDGPVIEAEHLHTWPRPDVLLAACRLLGVRPARTAVFETEPAGVSAGRAGGFERVIAVERHGGGDILLRNGADVVVADLEELLDRALGGRGLAVYPRHDMHG